MSFSALADIEFEGVRSSTQTQLINAIDKGIPIYYGHFDSGEVSRLKVANITKIRQHGSVFSICTGPATLYKVNFKCFKSEPCGYITSGGVTKARTRLEQCISTSP